jgi:hypothetical protein
MDHDLETLKRIAKRAGDKKQFHLESGEMTFFLMGQGSKWLKQVSTTKPPLFEFSDAGKKHIG